MSEHRTPEDVIRTALRWQERTGTEPTPLESASLSRRADQIMRALGEANFEVTDALFVYGGEQTWTDADLRTLILTAGEIASHYGTGTDGLDRDDVLSTRQRQVLRQAARQYHAETEDTP